MSALDDIAAERARQVSVEGWTPEHDDGHEQWPHGAALPRAAACYAMRAGLAANDHRFGIGYPPDLWPWSASWWKPADARRNLVKAAALIVAEIERLDRKAQGVGIQKAVQS